MKVAVFDTHAYDRRSLEAVNSGFGHELIFFETRLTEDTAGLAKGFPVVCSFVNDRLNLVTLERLHTGGTRLIALRSAGFNHVDLNAARRLGIVLARVPEYSPYAVAEHTAALILTLNRKTHRAYNRVRELNFSLDGLVGFDLHGKTIGIIGTGRIGTAFARIMLGFGCHILAYDANPNRDLAQENNLTYVPLLDLISAADIISLHVPLLPETRHMIDANAIASMKRGIMLINTSRGALIETKALIDALKTGAVGAAGLDVYEEEEGVFFSDMSECGVQDDVLARLLTFPNVLITSHQAFLTREALENIAKTTLENITAFEQGMDLVNRVL